MHISASTLLSAQQVRPQPAQRSTAAAKPFALTSFDAPAQQSGGVTAAAALTTSQSAQTATPPRPAARGMGSLLDITV